LTVGLVRIGRIVRAVGLDGLVGVAGSQGALGELRRVVLGRGTEEREPRQIEQARPHGRAWLLRLNGVNSREAAEALIGCEVWAAREDLGDPGAGFYYWADLEGMAVSTTDGRALGRVTGLIETGAVDVLVVTGERGEVLIPLAPYVTVDLAVGRVEVNPPEGLLELWE